MRGFSESSSSRSIRSSIAPIISPKVKRSLASSVRPKRQIAYARRPGSHRVLQAHHAQDRTHSSLTLLYTSPLEGNLTLRRGKNDQILNVFNDVRQAWKSIRGSRSFVIWAISCTSRRFPRNGRAERDLGADSRPRWNHRDSRLADRDHQRRMAVRTSTSLVVFQESLDPDSGSQNPRSQANVYRSTRRSKGDFLGGWSCGRRASDADPYLAASLEHCHSTCSSQQRLATFPPLGSSFGQTRGRYRNPASGFRPLRGLPGACRPDGGSHRTLAHFSPVPETEKAYPSSRPAH